MAIFSNNKDFDSSVLTVGFILVLLAHMAMTAFIQGYSETTAADRIGELLYAWGLAMIGFLFGRGKQQETTNAQQTTA